MQRESDAHEGRVSSLYPASGEMCVTLCGEVGNGNSPTHSLTSNSSAKEWILPLKVVPHTHFLAEQWEGEYQKTYLLSSTDTPPVGLPHHSSAKFSGLKDTSVCWTKNDLPTI